MHDEANMLGLALVIIAGTLAEYSAYAAWPCMQVSKSPSLNSFTPAVKGPSWA